MKTARTFSGPRALAALVFAAVSLSAAAQPHTGHDAATPATAEASQTMHVMKPYARATAAGQPAGGGFLTLHNAGPADRLIAASAPVSASVELHSMKMDGNVMRMRQVDAIDLPTNERVELKPGGLHLMFIGLKAPLKAGQSFPLTLKFEKAGELTVNARVEAVSASAKSETEHKH